MSNLHADRLAALREEMQKTAIDYYMFRTADYHNSEYIADFFKTVEYFSGFTGENATLIVSPNEADLWVDGRYFIQAEAEITGSGIVLQKSGEPGVPTVEAFLKENMPAGAVLGFDGRCVTRVEGVRLARLLSLKHITVNPEKDLAARVWTDRPALPSHPVFLLDEHKYAGETVESKLARLRKVMEEHGAAYYISSKLDEIMWLFNIRGGDVECNPVALSYALITRQHQYLFIQSSELTDEFLHYAQEKKIQVHHYGAFMEFLLNRKLAGPVMLDPAYTSYSVYLDVVKSLELGLADQSAGQSSAVANAPAWAAEIGKAATEQHRAAAPSLAGSTGAMTAGASKKNLQDYIIEMDSPVDYMKSIKNETEIRNFKDCYLEDSAALTKFIYWLKNYPDKRELTEGTAAKHLDELRAQIQDYVELSFATISAYGPNGAMMHYEPGYGGVPLDNKGMLLVDSGGHYLRGTTDVTRTMALGPVTQEMKKSYTLTAVSQLQMAGTIFLAGCCGMALDIMAREPMWKERMDYKCGTGHGIGYLLNVHEGPQTLRYRKRDSADTTPFVPGMVVSDEPGVYKAGQYGIRIETILLCVEKGTSPDGTFYGFEPLTYVPLDRELIDVTYLTPETHQALNAYHQAVYEKIAPYLTKEEQAWLKTQCAPI